MKKTLKYGVGGIVFVAIVCMAIYDMATAKKVVFKDRKALIDTYHLTINEITQNAPYLFKDEFNRQAGITYVEYVYQDMDNQLYLETKKQLENLKWHYIGSSKNNNLITEHYCKNGDGIDLSNAIKDGFYIKMYWDNDGTCKEMFFDNSSFAQ